jgi:hypothetical protein
VRQEGVLLGFVPAMDFVHEEDGALAVETVALLGTLDDQAQVRDAGQDSRDGDEKAFSTVSDNLCEGCLSGSGRSPQDDG